ncbi:MAG: DOMON domain-containing protein [Actinomycetota bacterium]|nr:DOMON domain-containing protein [Actinomycetota bacterium]
MKKNIALTILVITSVLVLSACSQPEIQVQSSGTDGYTVQNINTNGVVEENEYQFLVEDSATGLAVYWSQDNTLLYMGITGLGPGWAAVGFNPSFAMKDANIIMMAFSEDQALIRDDFGVSNFDHQPDTELGGTSDIEEHAGSPDAFEFVILLDSGDEYDQELIPGQTYKMILAVSDSPDFDSKHSKRSSVSVSLN